MAPLSHSGFSSYPLPLARLAPSRGDIDTAYISIFSESTSFHGLSLRVTADGPHDWMLCAPSIILMKFWWFWCQTSRLSPFTLTESIRQKQTLPSLQSLPLNSIRTPGRIVQLQLQPFAPLLPSSSRFLDVLALSLFFALGHTHLAIAIGFPAICPISSFLSRPNHPNPNRRIRGRKRS